jgi:hypothetical protein
MEDFCNLMAETIELEKRELWRYVEETAEANGLAHLFDDLDPVQKVFLCDILYEFKNRKPL